MGLSLRRRLPLSEDVARVATSAKREAQAAGCVTVGISHLTAALVRDAETDAARSLAEAGLRLDPMSEVYLEKLVVVETTPAGDHTAAYKKVFADAEHTARAAGESEVQPDHLLRALLRDGLFLAALGDLAIDPLTAQRQLDGDTIELAASGWSYEAVNARADYTSRLCLRTARKESQEMSCPFIGTEHLGTSLGVVMDAPGWWASARKYPPMQCERQLLIFDEREPPPADRTGAFTERARRALSIAGSRAETKGRDFIEAGDRLIGVIDCGPSGGGAALREHMVVPNEDRQRYRQPEMLRKTRAGRVKLRRRATASAQ